MDLSGVRSGQHAQAPVVKAAGSALATGPTGYKMTHNSYEHPKKRERVAIIATHNNPPED